MMMSISEFGAQVGLSPKTLRFYDESGVLVPREVDERTGYRFYDTAQLRTATTIRALRAAAVPLSDIEQMVREPDRAPALLERHRRAMQEERTMQDRAAEVSAALLVDADEPIAVLTRQVEAEHWVAASVVVSIDDADDHGTEWADGMVERLHEALVTDGNPPVGAFFTAMEVAAGASAVALLLAWPVGRLPSERFAVAGLDLRTGTLPARTEAYVRADASAFAVDPLDDLPGGRLLHPSHLAFAEHLDRVGAQPSQIRQRQIADDHGSPVAMELAATVDTAVG